MPLNILLFCLLWKMYCTDNHPHLKLIRIGLNKIKNEKQFILRINFVFGWAEKRWIFFCFATEKKKKNQIEK